MEETPNSRIDWPTTSFTTYRYNESGQLVMSVSMTSEKLASPIEYELVYAKAAP
jgi:hypothetical protein